MPPRKSASTSASAGAPITPSTPASITSKDSAPVNASDPVAVLQALWSRYWNTTPQRIKLLDAFLGYLVVVGVLQFLYCIVVGNYPFNAFISGFSAAVGQFVLTVSLRVQTSSAANRAAFEKGVSSDERAFADYVFGSLVLHFFCVNFIN